MIKLTVDKTGILFLRMDGCIADIMAEIVGTVGMIWASMPEDARPELKRILTKQFSEDGSVWRVLDFPKAMAEVETIKSKHCLLDGSAAEISPLGKKIIEALSRKEGER